MSLSSIASNQVHFYITSLFQRQINLGYWVGLNEHVVYLSRDSTDVNFLNARIRHPVENILNIDSAMDAFLFIILFFVIVNSATEQYILRAGPTYRKLGSSYNGVQKMKQVKFHRLPEFFHTMLNKKWNAIFGRKQNTQSCVPWDYCFVIKDCIHIDKSFGHSSSNHISGFW
jgi:hypothetical protein